jgi:hypothetical protein
VEILEALEADYGYYQVSVSTCDSWVYTNSLTHPVLRDLGNASSIAQTLALPVKEMIIVDRQLKIVFKGRVTTTFDQNQVLNVLGNLQ